MHADRDQFESIMSLSTCLQESSKEHIPQIIVQLDLLLTTEKNAGIQAKARALKAEFKLSQNI